MNRYFVNKDTTSKDTNTSLPSNSGLLKLFGSTAPFYKVFLCDPLMDSADQRCTTCGHMRSSIMKFAAVHMQF